MRAQFGERQEPVIAAHAYLSSQMRVCGIGDGARAERASVFKLGLRGPVNHTNSELKIVYSSGVSNQRRSY